MSGGPLRIDAGAIEEFPPSSERVVPLPPDATAPRREAVVIHDEQGVLRAYVNRCRHLPIPLDAGSRRFRTPDGRHLLCRTHGAVYRLEDGACTRGPCDGRGLHALGVELEVGRVILVLDPEG